MTTFCSSGDNRANTTLLRLEKVARALHVAHDHGVVHRDVKPTNVMIDEHGEPVVIDFGLACPEASSDSDLTLTGDLVGTPAYMAPEQVRGAAVDRRTDVYAIGVTTYQALTGQLPHRGVTSEEIYRSILAGEFTPPSRLAPAVSRDLEVVIQTALEHDPERRTTTIRCWSQPSS